MFAVSFAIGAGVYVWYSVMLAKVFAHAGLAPWSAWVPVYSQMQVFRLGGQNPWLALLLVVPIVQVAGLFFQILALHRISGQYWRGVGTTVLGVLLPPVWATVLAVGPSPDPERGRMPVRGASTGTIPPVAPGAPREAALAAVTAGWPAPGGPAGPGAPGSSDLGALAAPAFAVAAPVAPVAPAPTQAGWPAGDSAPILPPWADLHPRGAAPLPPMPAAAPAAPAFLPAQPPVAAAAGPAPAPLATPIADPISRIPGRIEPIQAMPAASAAPLEAAPAAPVSPALPTLPPVGALSGGAPYVTAPAEPITVGAPVVAAPPVADPFAVAAPAPFTEPLAPGTVVTGDDDLDDDLLDRTVVVARKPAVTWHLVPEGGEPLRLAGRVVLLGRNPRAADPGAGEQRLVVPDPSRTLSKTHAVLSLDGEQWSITDLHSTNGVLVPDGFGDDVLLDPDVPTPVPDRFVLGTLSVRIERDPPIAGVPGR
ncbi:hypothetical protein GCM10009717_23270 [Agromyces allii]|uniref:FHA domain-containing protein n=4 Tax=Agromyces allii TaxID=393607 RepID=A0ABN2QQE3_9MICO